MAIFHKVRIDIPVTGFQLSDQCTFGHLSIAEKPVTPETGFAGENYPYPNGQQSFDSFGFDPEEEDDRELLREDPYAEYLDFPEEYRMRDQAQQAEMVYC